MNFKIYYFTLVAFLLLNGCKMGSKGEENNLTKLDKETIEDWVFQYNLTGNKSFLDSSYNKLKQLDYFNNNSLDSNNIDLIYQIYFGKRKYSEFINLLERSKDLKKDDKVFLMNLSKSYDYYQKGNSKKGDEFIRKNIEIKRKEIQRNKKDSIAILDFLLLKTHIENQEELLLEIDSLKNSSKNISNAFFEEIIKSEIKEKYRNIPDFIKK